MVATAAAEPQPQSGASMTPKMRVAMAALDSARPDQSIRGVRGSREVGTATATRTATATATRAMKAKMLPHQ